MKTKNNKTMVRLMGGSVLGYLVVLALLFATGCNKSSGNRNSHNPNAYPNGGYNPGYSTGGVTAAGVEMNGQGMMILSISVQNTGAAYAQGELRVYQPIACPFNPNIGFNPGRYGLQPMQNQQPASYSGNSIYNLSLVAQGQGVQALLSTPFVNVVNTNVCGYSGLLSIVNVATLNGMNCGLSLYFWDQASSNMCM